MFYLTQYNQNIIISIGSHKKINEISYILVSGFLFFYSKPLKPSVIYASKNVSIQTSCIANSQ